jgi:hypothetical protein
MGCSFRHLLRLNVDKPENGVNKGIETRKFSGCFVLCTVSHSVQFHEKIVLDLQISIYPTA